MNQLPCNTCIVFASCNAKVKEANIYIFKVIKLCTIIRKFLKIIESTNTHFVYEDGNEPKENIKILAKRFNLENAYFFKDN